MIAPPPARAQPRSKDARGVRACDNARALMTDGFPDAYADVVQRVFTGWQENNPVTRSQDVVNAVWRAVTDPSCPMWLPAGADALAIAGEPGDRTSIQEGVAQTARGKAMSRAAEARRSQDVAAVGHFMTHGRG